MLDYVDYEINDELPCSECHNDSTHYRRCDCGNGWLDVYDDDPINYVEGEHFVTPEAHARGFATLTLTLRLRCPKCSGSGLDVWCPRCGTDLSDRALEELTRE